MIDQLLQTLGDEISKFLDSPIVKLALEGNRVLLRAPVGRDGLLGVPRPPAAHHEPGRARTSRRR